MSYGLEIYLANGDLHLSSENIGHMPVDTFIISKVGNPTGTKTYPDVDPDSILSAILLPTKYTSMRASVYNQRLAPLLDVGGYFDITTNHTNKTVSWEWVPPEIPGGGGYSEGMVFVSIGGGP